MQGYLSPNRLDLTIRQNRNYFHSQCGLCQQLKKDYGTLARFNRDALILQLLTEAQLQQEPPHQKIRCAVQPFLHSAKANPKAAQFAAAVTVMMFWGKLMDTIADANGVSGFFIRPVAKFLLWKNRHKIKKAETILQKLGFDVQVIYDLFEQQQKLEQVAESLDDVASPTAQGLAALFAHTAILANRPENIDILKHLGEEVGAMLYILDARDDLFADIRRKRFNPLTLTSISLAESKATAFLRQKFQVANEVFSGFETRSHQELLGNIFSLGLQKHLERSKAPNQAMALSGDCDPGGCDAGGSDPSDCGQGSCNLGSNSCSNSSFECCNPNFWLGCCDYDISSSTKKTAKIIAITILTWLILVLFIFS
ncbi:hypothetical protein PN36_30285 [Candidatus Thiomargarita nelsonii]|uniref:Uncharacterized protein n=1 Tax=Candidatus Thiomargarita nelsonii TaxID=1003181 RepID=A0A0A6P2M4_9GAMM|nr:hypothetical protein PN36_30285 [Candidatus Thiomargarita nelsonii]